MLKGIDALLSGELLKALDELGHGESLALVDRNYPAFASGAQVVRLDVGVVRAAEAILSVFPLDYAVPPLAKMEAYDDPRRLMPNHTRVWEAAREAAQREFELENVPRFAFYDRARVARLVVLTREDEPYNDFLLVKGVVSGEA